MPDPSIGAERIDSRVPGRCRSVRAHDLVIVNRDPEVKIFLEKVIRVGELSGKWFENATEASGYLEVFMPGILLVSVECAGQVEDIGELRGRVAPGLSVMAVGVDPRRDLVVKAMAAGATTSCLPRAPLRSFPTSWRSCCAAPGARAPWARENLQASKGSSSSVKAIV